MTIKAGFSKICINPPLGAPISGYYMPRFTKGILDDIYVRAVAFDDGKKKAVIVTLDLCLLTAEQFALYKNTISKFCNIPYEAVFITCSHTHTAPIVGKDFASELCSDPTYDAHLAMCIRDAAAFAFEDLSPARMYSAKSEAKGISFCRRYRMKDGSVRTNPGVGNPDIDHPLGTPNDTVKLIKLVRDGTDDICLVNFGTHPDTIGGEYISGDWPGYVCSGLEAAVPGIKCMFLLAPQGDVNHVNVSPTPGEAAISAIDFDDVPRSLKHAKHMARVIVGAVLSVFTISEEIKSGDISYATKAVRIASNQENDRLDEARKINELYSSGKANELPYDGMELTTVVAEAERIINLSNGPESFEFVLSALKVGDLVFGGLPGEPFTEIANRIYDSSPFDNTILCCISNSNGPYFPTSKAYSEGGYEARSSTLKPGGDDIIVNGMCELLNEIK
ncbi:MAG: hypothetical protein IKV73_00615 [Clostridia bacterium]|nr:hypothetical protein [Clostridia bacterium]